MIFKKKDFMKVGPSAFLTSENKKASYISNESKTIPGPGSYLSEGNKKNKK